MSLAVPHYRISTIKRFRHFYEACQLAYLQYRQSGLSDHHPNGIRLSLRDLLPDSATFVALQDDDVVATVTGVRWSPCRLPASSTFSKEIEQIVSTGAIITEGTKFASRAHEFGFPKEKGKLTVVSEDLLKTVLYWSSLVGASSWVNVVHPKHLPYFAEQLGFSILSDSRDCAHVSDHPGVLIGLSTSDCFPSAAPTATEYLRSHYLNEDIGLSRFQNHYRIGSHEAAFLLLESPELIERATEPERLLFDWFYPRVAERLSPYLMHHQRHTQRTPSLSAALSPLIDLPAQMSCDTVEIYEPILYLQKIGAIASELAAAQGKNITLESNSVNSSLCLNPHYEAGKAFSTILSAVLSTSPNGSNNQIALRTETLDTNSTRLTVSWDNPVDLSLLWSTIKDYPEWGAPAEPTESCSSIEFPLLIHAPSDKIELVLSNEETHTPRSAILIISSSTLESRILRIMVSQLGYLPLIAETTEEVMSIWKNNHIVCGIVDLASPGTGGFSACRRIRSSGAWGTKVPIIACTGYPLHAVNDACNEAGITACISKPLSLPKLTTMIKELTSEHTAPLPLDSESIVTTIYQKE
jgi:CheY-like chemotaxis protein